MRPWFRLFQVLVLLLVMAASVAGMVLARGAWIATRKEHERPVPLAVAASDSLVDRGRRLAIMGCRSCHAASTGSPLAGSPVNALANDAGVWLGEVTAPNLTPAGVLAGRGEAQLARAIREGIGLDGRTLIGMPSNQFRHLSDRDVAALIAFLRSQPATPGGMLPRRLSVAGYAALGLGRVPVDRPSRVTGAIRSVADGTSPEYGRYVARYLGCGNCHGSDYRGGGTRQPNRGPDLVQLATQHPIENFDRAVRHGKTTSGRLIDPRSMPWENYAALDDSEVVALYRYFSGGAIWD